MSALLTFLTVLFLFLCILLIIVILLQSDKSAGMGILGGSSQSAFGSSTADVITKITAVMVALFMFGSLGLAIFKTQTTVSLDDKFEKTGAAVKTNEEKGIKPIKSDKEKGEKPTVDKSEGKTE